MFLMWRIYPFTTVNYMTSAVWCPTYALINFLYHIFNTTSSKLQHFIKHKHIAQFHWEKPLQIPLLQMTKKYQYRDYSDRHALKWTYQTFGKFEASLLTWTDAPQFKTVFSKTMICVNRLSNADNDEHLISFANRLKQ